MCLMKLWYELMEVSFIKISDGSNGFMFRELQVKIWSWRFGENRGQNSSKCFQDCVVVSSQGQVSSEMIWKRARYSRWNPWLVRNCVMAKVGFMLERYSVMSLNVGNRVLV